MKKRNLPSWEKKHSNFCLSHLLACHLKGSTLLQLLPVENTQDQPACLFLLSSSPTSSSLHSLLFILISFPHFLLSLLSILPAFNFSCKSFIQYGTDQILRLSKISISSVIQLLAEFSAKALFFIVTVSIRFYRRFFFINILLKNLLKILSLKRND